jgi:hypothetical protein
MKAETNVEESLASVSRLASSDMDTVQRRFQNFVVPPDACIWLWCVNTVVSANSVWNEISSVPFVFMDPENVWEKILILYSAVMFCC